MNDQAHVLREMINSQKENIDPSSMHIIVVTSGKGGVGKSNLSVNLALALQALGKKSIILDADLGLANVEIILGEAPKYNLSHLLSHECELNQIITESKYGISYISGGAGIKELCFLSEMQLEEVSRQLVKLSDLTDLLIIDTGAGINESVLKFCELANEIYVVVTPEPTSITDSYALIKTLVKNHPLKGGLKLLINKAESQQEAHQVFNKLNYVCEKFLSFPVKYAGFIPYDDIVFKAVKQQKPAFIYERYAKVSRAYYEVARAFLKDSSHNIVENGENESLLNKLKRIFLHK